MYMTKLLGQSSAAHTSSDRHQPVGAGEIERVLDRRGEQFVVDRPRPGCTRNPSPGTRSGPQTKQAGNGCQSGCTTTGDAAAAARATASDGGAGASTSTIAGTASAIVASPSRRTSRSPAAASTVSGVSSGDGSRNVTSAGPSMCAASSPAVTPPFPRSGGPAEPRRGSRPSRRPSGDDDRYAARHARLRGSDGPPGLGRLRPRRTTEPNDPRSDDVRRACRPALAGQGDRAPGRAGHRGRSRASTSRSCARRPASSRSTTAT